MADNKDQSRKETVAKDDGTKADVEQLKVEVAHLTNELSKHVTEMTRIKDVLTRRNFWS